MRTLVAVYALCGLLAVGNTVRADDAGTPPSAGAPAAAAPGPDAGAPQSAPDEPNPGLFPSTKPTTRWPRQPPRSIPHEPGTQYRMPTTPPVGACLGGSCAPPARPPVRLPAAPGLCFQGVCADPSLSEYARARPMEPPGLAGERRHVPRRERFAYTGAVLGTVSAGLLLGGAIAIAAVDAPDSERVTRGVFLSYTAVSVPLVALSTWLARKESGFAGYRGLQTLGWLSYAVAVSDGAFLWSDAFRHEHGSKLLTVAAGAFAALALLPHALEAVTAARSIRIKRFTRHLGASGFSMRF